MKGLLSDTAARIVMGLVLIATVVFTITTCTGRGKQVAQSKQNERTANATTDAAQDAVDVVVKRAGEDAKIDQIVNEAAKDIANAEGSNQPVPPAARDAALRAACRLRSYAQRPSCKMLGDGAGDMAGRR